MKLMAFVWGVFVGVAGISLWFGSCIHETRAAFWDGGSESCIYVPQNPGWFRVCSDEQGLRQWGPVQDMKQRRRRDMAVCFRDWRSIKHHCECQAKYLGSRDEICDQLEAIGKL